MRIWRSGDAQIIRAARRLDNKPPGGKKKPLTWLTAKARTKMLFTIRNTSVRFKSMFCLTYPATYPRSGKEVKGHLNAWLVWYRRNLKGVPYFWFLEFQRRGAPHIHIYIAEQKANLPHREMAVAWAAIVAGDDQEAYGKVLAVHQHNSQLQDFRSRDGSVRYAAKYALKTYQKAVPAEFRDVGRFWGASRDVKNSIPSGDLVAVSDRDVETHLHQVDHRCQAYDFVPKVVFGMFEE